MKRHCMACVLRDRDPAVLQRGSTVCAWCLAWYDRTLSAPPRTCCAPQRGAFA